MKNRRMIVKGLAGAAAMIALMGGCAQPLLSPDEERSPFDRYDGIRSQSVPQQTEDEYGRIRPNLRPRLTPKGQ